MNGSLTFSDFGSSYVDNEKKSNFRKAGEVFTNSNNNNSSGSSSAKSAYDSWMTNLSNGSQYQSNSSSSSNSQSTDNSGNTKPAPLPDSWEPTSDTSGMSASGSTGSTSQTPKKPFYMKDRKGKEYSTKEEWDSMIAAEKAELANQPSAGTKMSQGLKPENRKKAAAFFDHTMENYGSNPELAGNILTHMGGDLFLPDPEQWKASMQKQYGNDPKLLSNILTHMGGGA